MHDRTMIMSAGDIKAVTSAGPRSSVASPGLPPTPLPALPVGGLEHGSRMASPPFVRSHMVSHNLHRNWSNSHSKPDGGLKLAIK